jgi:hypothetical protein
MKKDINHPKNLFGLHDKAVTWEEATRENLLKRLLMSPIRFGFCAPVKQVYFAVVAIIATAFILGSWDFTRGTSIVYIYGILAIILSFIFAFCGLIRCMLAYFEESDILLKNFYHPHIFGSYWYTDVDFYFSSFSKTGILSEHKDTSNDLIVKNISVPLSDYLYKTKTDSRVLSSKENEEVIHNKKALDIICHILYAEMQADKAAEYASEIISSPDSVLFEEYQDIIAEYKAMRKEAIEELNNYVGEKVKAYQGQKDIQKALSNTPTRKATSEAQSWDAKFEKV